MCPEAPVTPAEPSDPDLRDPRWELIRDVLVFQAKMILEGTRDILLPFATLGAALVGIVRGGDRPEAPFHNVLRLGARFDVWLNLFGPTREPGRDVPLPEVGEGADRYVRSLEQLIVEQHERGQLTRQAKHAIDGWLDRIQETAGPRARSGTRRGSKGRDEG